MHVLKRLQCTCIVEGRCIYWFPAIFTKFFGNDVQLLVTDVHDVSRCTSVTAKIGTIINKSTNTNILIASIYKYSVFTIEQCELNSFNNVKCQVTNNLNVAFWEVYVCHHWVLEPKFGFFGLIESSIWHSFSKMYIEKYIDSMPLLILIGQHNRKVLLKLCQEPMM